MEKVTAEGVKYLDSEALRTSSLQTAHKILTQLEPRLQSHDPKAGAILRTALKQWDRAKLPKGS